MEAEELGNEYDAMSMRSWSNKYDLTDSGILPGIGDRGRWGYHTIKRSFDIVFSGAVIAISFIPSVILGIVIRSDSRGPAIYKRWCVGKDGIDFPMYKFRTMRTEPPEELLSPEQYRQWKTEVKVDNDPRITKIGKKLRSVSLDELPQFVNVLKGEMSIVGPRPVTREEAEKYGPYKDALLSVKPGITGYWQVYGREDTDYSLNSSRVGMQLYYINHQSVGLDAKIFFKTIQAVLKKTGK